MPGLWDMHVHFGGGPELIEENKDLLPLYVAYGVTTVRDCAADISQSVLEWRRAVAEGRLLGPRIFTSGPKLEGYKPLWKGTIEVGTPAEVDAALDRLQAMKVDFVKITDNTLKPDIFLYAVKEAKRRGLKTSAHTPYALTIVQAADAGLSSVEHVDYLIKAGSPEEAAIGADYAAGKTELRPGLRRLRRDLRRGLCGGRLSRLAERGHRSHADAQHGPHPRLSRPRRSFEGPRPCLHRPGLAQDLRLAGRTGRKGDAGAGRRAPQGI